MHSFNCSLWWLKWQQQTNTILHCGWHWYTLGWYGKTFNQITERSGRSSRIQTNTNRYHDNATFSHNNAMRQSSVNAYSAANTWPTSRRSYMINRTAPFSWPWTTPIPGFKVTPSLTLNISETVRYADMVSYHSSFPYQAFWQYFNGEPLTGATRT